MGKALGASGGPEAQDQWLLSAVQELSRVKAVALSERGQAEEELIKAKNQVRLEEVSPACCPQCPPEWGLRSWCELPR